jgi:hypothetical protein
LRHDTIVINQLPERQPIFVPKLKFGYPLRRLVPDSARA